MLQLISIALFFAFCTFTVKSQDCSMHTVNLVCRSIENYNWFKRMIYGDSVKCIADESISWTIPGASVSLVLHRNGMKVTNLADIKRLEIYGATVNFIPTGIKRKFPNLRGLCIAASGLLSIDKENLREFGDTLENLDLYNNRLNFLNDDLFEFNQNLEVINLHENPIRHIENEFFTNLRKLRNIEKISLVKVGCMSQLFQTSDGHNIATFKWNNGKCTDQTARDETQISINKALCDEVKSTLELPDFPFEFLTRSQNKTPHYNNKEKKIVNLSRWT